jgi:hypothetical protein
MKYGAQAFFAAAFLSLAGSVSAEEQSMKAECYDRSNLLFALAAEHGEKLDQTRRVGGNGLLEAFKSAKEGTWTIVYSNDDKISCVLATGGGLETDGNDTETATNDLTI